MCFFLDFLKLMHRFIKNRIIELVVIIVLIVIVIFGNAPALKGIREKYSFSNLFKKKTFDPAATRDDAGSWDRIPTKINMDEILTTELNPNEAFTPDKPDRPKSGGKENK